MIMGDREGRNRTLGNVQHRVGGVNGADRAELRFLYMLSHRAFDSVAK